VDTSTRFRLLQQTCTAFRFEGGGANTESFADFLERFEQLCESLHCTGSEKLQLLSGGVLTGRAYQKLSTVMQQHLQQHNQQPSYDHVKQELMKCYRTDSDREKEVTAFETIRLRVGPGGEDTCFADFTRRFDQLHMRAERASQELYRGTYHPSKVNEYFVAALPGSVRDDLDKTMEVNRASLADLKSRAERLYKVHARSQGAGESFTAKRSADSELDAPTRKRAAVALDTKLYDKISGLLHQIPACVAHSLDSARIKETTPEKQPSVTRPTASGAAKRSQTPLCFSFQQGRCGYGTSCRFSHAIHTEPSGTVCRMFEQKGICSYGSKCKYSHGTIASRGTVAPLVPYQRNAAVAEIASCWSCGAADHEWHRCRRRCHACGSDEHLGFNCRISKDGVPCSGCRKKGHVITMCRDQNIREQARAVDARGAATMRAAASVQSPVSGIVHPDRLTQVPHAQNQVLSDLTNALKDVSKQLAAKNDA
jgi:hypothetical protein